MARRTKYTPEVSKRICKAIRLGATFDRKAPLVTLEPQPTS